VAVREHRERIARANKRVSGAGGRAEAGFLREGDQEKDLAKEREIMGGDAFRRRRSGRGKKSGSD
jgi:hypothetical protein